MFPLTLMSPFAVPIAEDEMVTSHNPWRSRGLCVLFGGMLADRLIGFRKAVTWGALLMAAGHFTMAFESQLNLALGLLIVGNGFFKPNMSSIVGRLYGPDDPRRDSGYTIFYVSVNIGALLSPLVLGLWIVPKFGLHTGFTVAGFGSALLGLMGVARGKKA